MVKEGEMHILNVSGVGAKVYKYFKNAEKKTDFFFHRKQNERSEWRARLHNLIFGHLVDSVRILQEATMNKTKTLTHLTSAIQSSQSHQFFSPQSAASHSKDKTT